MHGFLAISEERSKKLFLYSTVLLYHFLASDAPILVLPPLQQETQFPNYSSTVQYYLFTKKCRTYLNDTRVNKKTGTLLKT